jgi:hypothetical protein
MLLFARPSCVYLLEQQHIVKIPVCKIAAFT